MPHSICSPFAQIKADASVVPSLRLFSQGFKTNTSHPQSTVMCHQPLVLIRHQSRVTSSRLYTFPQHPFTRQRFQDCNTGRVANQVIWAYSNGKMSFTVHRGRSIFIFLVKPPSGCHTSDLRKFFQRALQGELNLREKRRKLPKRLKNTYRAPSDLSLKLFNTREKELKADYPANQRLWWRCFLACA